jgi:dCMP deaminase
MREPIGWDEMFMTMASLIALRSKDDSTQVGAIAVSPDKRSVAVGYNGMVVGYPEDDALWTRPMKYNHVIHAEENVIVNAARSGTSLDGWTLYVTLHPCFKCARLVAQCGIKSVIYTGKNERTSEHKFELAREIFRKAGVRTREFE